MRERARRQILAQRSHLKNVTLDNKDYSDYITSLEDDYSEAVAKIQGLEGDAGFLELQISELEDERNLLRAQVTSLHDGLSNVRNTRSPLSLTTDQRDLLARCVGKTGSVSDALDIIESLFSDRVVILPTARDSARDSAKFRSPDKVLTLLMKLCTQYWDSLASGQGGDAQAKGVFGDAYAANESETTMGRAGAVRRRTFDYRGHPVLMAKHLRIGIKPSAAETWRAHFEWFADERAIVIGHCGPHLDFR